MKHRFLRYQSMVFIFNCQYDVKFRSLFDFQNCSFKRTHLGAATKPELHVRQPCRYVEFEYIDGTVSAREETGLLSIGTNKSVQYKLWSRDGDASDCDSWTWHRISIPSRFVVLQTIERLSLYPWSDHCSISNWYPTAVNFILLFFFLYFQINNY